MDELTYSSVDAIQSLDDVASSSEVAVGIAMCLEEVGSLDSYFILLAKLMPHLQ